MSTKGGVQDPPIKVKPDAEGQSLPTSSAAGPITRGDSDPQRPGKAARNEGRKAVATLLNGLSAAGLITAGLQAALTGNFEGRLFFAALAAFIVMQGALHYLLRRIED